MSNVRAGSRAGMRVPTGQRQINQDTMKSIGFTTDTKVIDRAVSRQGLSGVVQGSGGQKIERKIQDKTYYITLLKTKINDISKEILTMNNEIGSINSDMTTYANLNKQYETLSKEVQNLEGELADYNLAGDKYRSMMKADDIEDVYNRMKLYNKKKMDESDNLFLERAKILDELQEVETENSKVLQNIEQRLLDLDPDQKAEYEQIREDNQNYIMKIYQLREEMAKLNGDLIEGENILKSNPNKMEAHKLKDSISQLQRKKEELELQTNEAGLSIEELKQRLVQKAKEQTLEKNNIDKKIPDTKKIIESHKKSIIELEREMKSNANNDNTKAVDSISQKDKEYSAFIENYDSIKRNHYKEIQAKEEVVVALLENISEKINSGQTPLENSGAGIKEKIREKKDMIEKSVNTLEEAKAKYEELVVKLQRLEKLDETLKKDIKNYKDKLGRIHNEINEKFERIDEQKDFLERDSKRMKDLLVILKQNKENYNKLLTSLVLNNRTKNAQLEENDIFKRMRELEKKMQANENTIYGLQTYIESKANDNEYSGLLKECMALQKQINDELLKKY
jgi:intraflagellar transport protein 74